MIRLRMALAVGIVVAGAACSGALAAGGGHARADAGRFRVAYGTPHTADEKVLMTLMKASLLDKVAAELSKQLVIPRDVTIRIVTADAGPYFDPATKSVVFGLPFAATMLKVIKAEYPRISNYELGRAFAQLEYFILFHELGHSLVDAWHVPVLGREEDAVDAFSTILLLQIKQGDAAVWGADFFNAISKGQGFGAADFADEHSLSPQRAYSIACWVYGADPVDYPGLKKFIPKERLVRCAGEFQQLRDAWVQFLKPHIRTA